MQPDFDNESQSFRISTNPIGKTLKYSLRLILGIAIALVLGMLVWQGVTTHGVPDPLVLNRAPGAAILDISILVFREGLESILVLMAITASMTGVQSHHRRPVALGAGAGFFATILTWFIAVGIVGSLTASVSALNLQAATGLLAVVVLLIVMNWFFHKVYWGGWIGLHNRERKKLMTDSRQERISKGRLMFGLALLGFSSFYREGFEVVLFLQSYRLKLGDNVVLLGTVIGLILTGIVAAITFVAHRKLPYRKMLVFTGIMLGAVLLVMVGEEAQEMQLAHWVPTTEIHWLSSMPPWMGLWFGVSPTIETLAAQGLAAALVIGSYFAASRSQRPKASSDETVASAQNSKAASRL